MSGTIRFSRAASVLAGLVTSVLSGAVSAQEARLTLEVDKHLAHVDEVVQVKVTVLTQGGGYDEFIPPDFSAFRTGRGGLTSRNIEMINWNVRRRETHVYTIFPQRAGKFVIGPAMVKMSGKIFRSPQVTISVRASKGASPGAVAPQPAPQDPIGAPPARTPRPDDEPNPSLDRPSAQRDVFIFARAIPPSVYVGQQLVVEWQLYTQRDVMNFHPTKHPVAENFWTEDLLSPRQLEFEPRPVAGETYYAATLARKAFFPQRAGKLSITPMVARLRVMGGFSATRVTRRSNDLAIEVKPLPEQGKPVGFPEQNVGTYELAATLDRSEVSAGDAITLKLIVRGEGNIRQLKLPELKQLTGFKVYEPKVVDELTSERSVSGEKRVEYLILPTKGGQLIVPSLALHYFDPGHERYKTSRTEPLTVSVVGDVTEQASRGPAPPGAATNVLGPDIRPPRLGAALRHHAPFRLFSRWPLVIFLLPLGLLLASEVTARLRHQLSKPTERGRARAANRAVRRHLQVARQHRGDSDPSRFFAALDAALREQLSYSTGVAVEGMTRPQLRESLTERGVAVDLVERSLAELERCDTWRFAPGSADDSHRDQAHANVCELVSRIAAARSSTTNPATHRPRAAH